MAVFPTAADLNRPIPQSGGGVASFRPQAPRGAEPSQAGAQALFDAGRQSQEFGSFLEKLTGDLETTAAQDALNKLRTKRAELTYDPEKGFMRVKGGDVLKDGPDGKKIQIGVPEGFQKEIDDIGGTLITPNARKLFMDAAGREMVAFKTDLGRHIASEGEKYQGAVDKDTQTQILAGAAQFYNDPDAIEALVKRAESAAEKTALRTGMPSQAVAMRSNVLRVAVESLLNAGNNRQALAYFDSVKGRLDGPDAVALQSKLKSVNADLNGENAANDALVSLGLPPIASGDGSVLAYGAKVRQHESGGLYNVRNNPDTNAGGAYQFIDSTWVSSARKFLPEQTKGLTDAEVLKLRGNAQAQDAVFAGFTRDNEADLAKAGLPVNDTTRYLAHWFGSAGAIRLLKADPKAPIDQFLPAGKSPTGKSWAEANGIAGKTVGQVLAVAGQRMGEPVSLGSPSAFKGDTVAGYQQAAASIAGRTDLTTAEKAKALALITQQRTQTEGLRAASVKSLDDYSQTVLTTAMLDPSKYKDGTLTDVADRYESLGEGAKATRFRVLAAMEGPLKTFATTASEGQRSMLTSVLEGLPKQIAEGLKKGDTEAKAQAKLRAGNLFSQAKESFGKGVAPDGLADTLKEAATLYAAVGDEEHAREVHQFYDSAYKAHAANQQPTTAATQTLSDLKGLADQAGTNAATLQTFSLMKETYDRQQGDLQKDALAAGSRIYKDVGQLPAIDWNSPENVWQAIDIRNNQARKVKELSGNETAPFTSEEFERFRGVLDAGPLEQKKMLLRTLGRTVGNDLLNVTAVKLAGKDDEVATMYASALARYGEGDPGADAVAEKILLGAQIMKNGGEAGRKPASTSDAWQTELQDKLGNVLALHLGDKVPAAIAASIKAHYVASMWAAGKQGEKTDSDQLDKSIQAVTGGIVTYRGQQMFAPGPNATSYDIDAALQTLTSADIPPDLKTLEGDQITAEAIKRNARLLSAGAGIYAVRIPDPRANGELRPITDPRTGKAWTLDLRPLLERAKDAAPAIPSVIFNP